MAQEGQATACPSHRGLRENKSARRSDVLSGTAGQTCATLPHVLPHYCTSSEALVTASHYFQVDGKKPMVMKLTTKRCGADEAPSARHPSTETLLTAPVRIAGLHHIFRFSN